LLATLQDILKENLVGMYLHGSLAMDCFNPARSDIDLFEDHIFSYEHLVHPGSGMNSVPQEWQ
jgi:hypothetical protein